MLFKLVRLYYNCTHSCSVYALFTRTYIMLDYSTTGFHLSGVLCPPQTAITPVHLRDGFKTGVVFDRQRITANSCTCEQSAWCQHIVALCLHRVHQVNSQTILCYLVLLW